MNDNTVAAQELVEYLKSGTGRVIERLGAALPPLTDPDMASSDLAHVYASLRMASDIWSNVGSMLSDVISKLGSDLIPAAFERDGVTSFNTSTGFRVGISTSLRASIKSGFKDDAYGWLRANGLGDLITETVNSSTLSAAGRHLIEEGKELDENLFNSHYQVTTSLTKIPVKTGKVKV